ncbi:MAG TPA: VOC family protein [Nitrosopumilaceae archaeon]|nr:VOC family protein [Nitrosopumilaceae archaeon]
MDKVIHFEIPADNVGRAQDFYKSIFGWKIVEVPDMDYYFVTTVEADQNMIPKEPGAINGGMLKRSVPSEQPVIVIQVTSIDEYLKKISSSGGKVILPKMTVGSFGFYARVTDTEGNVIGLWETPHS